LLTFRTSQQDVQRGKNNIATIYCNSTGVALEQAIGGNDGGPLGTADRIGTSARHGAKEIVQLEIMPEPPERVTREDKRKAFEPS
jgi:hypothetical protein